MVTEKIKANAIALMKMGDPPEKVAEDLELPPFLVREWFNNLDKSALIALQANVTAAERVLNGVVLSGDTTKIEKLRDKIEDTAIEIIDEAKRIIPFGDIQAAKALHLLSDTCAKLYGAVINKGQTNLNLTANPVTNAQAMFEELNRN